MTRRTVERRIRKLKIPQDAKECLLRLWTKSKALIESILTFIRQHRHLSESLLVGAIVAFLLCKLPWIGDFLGLLVLMAASAVGLMRELRAQMGEALAVPPTA